jgi:hypothetical protein
VSRRIPVVVILVGLLVAGLVYDRADDGRDADTSADVPDASVFPIAADPDALSSTWYCAGGTADDERFADHVVRIANPTSGPISVTVTVFGGSVAPPLETVEGEDLDDPEAGDGTESGNGGPDGESGSGTESAEAQPEGERREPVIEVIEMAANSRRSLALRELVTAPVASALVETSTGGVVVEHEVRSIHGFDVKPCVTSPASTWHFAWGDTTAEARHLLVLFNPFPDDAIVDGTFSTEEGARAPERFDGFVVPARGTVAVDVGDDVTRREEVAATITARNGRIVVDRIVRLDDDPDRGLTVQAGVPEPQPAWVYPEGLVSEAVREEYVVYNPGQRVAEVEIEFLLDDPETNGIPPPVELSLPPGSHQRVDVRADGRVPDLVSHSAIVRTLNGVPVVAERVHFSDGRARRGVSVTTGSPVEARRWNFAAGSVTEDVEEWLVLVNVDPEILTEVDVTAVSGGRAAPVSGLQGLEIRAGGRLAIDLSDHLEEVEDLAVVVASTEPVVVERNLYLVGDDQRGISAAVGVPSPLEIRRPPDPLAAGADGGP